MLPEIVGADPELVALGLQPTVEERIAEVLMKRYRAHAIATYLRTLEQVESEELLALSEGGDIPAGYLAHNSSKETPLGGGFNALSTRWAFLLRLPNPAQLLGALTLSRSRVVGVIKSLTYGSDNPGVIENDDNPGSPWAYSLSEWATVDAAKPTLEGAALRTLIGFTFESKIHSTTREVY